IATVVAGGAGGGGGGSGSGTTGSNGQSSSLARSDTPVSPDVVTNGRAGLSCQGCNDAWGDPDGGGGGGGGGGVAGGQALACSGTDCDGIGAYAGTNGVASLATVTSNTYVAPSQNGSITVTYNAVFAATMTPVTTPVSGSQATFNLSFNFNIVTSSLTTSDFTLATGSGVASGCAVTGVSGSGATYVVTVSGCTSDGTVTPKLSATSVTVASDASVPAALQGTSGPSGITTSSAATIDNVAPAVPTVVDLATASDTGTSTTDNVTNDNTPTMSATLAGGVAGDVVTITAAKAGSAPVSCSYTLTGQSSCTLGALADGVWSMTATAADSLGNTSAVSAPLSVTIDTSTTAGTPDLVAASDTGSSSTDNVTNDTTPAISAVGAVDGDTVTVNASRTGGGSATCTYVKSPSVTSCDLGPLAAGDWAVTTSATDPAGNTAGPVGGLTFTLDTTAPSAPSAPDLVASSDLGTSSTDNNTSDNTPAMSAGSVPDGSTVTMTATKAGSANVTCSYVASPSVSSCDLGTLADGTWNISATVTDPAGNTSAAGSALPVTIDTAPPGAPSLPDLAAASDTGSSNTDNVTADSTPTVSAAGAATGETVTMTATKAGSTPVSCSYVVGSASSCDLGTLADGTWSLSATVTDTTGNVSPSSSALPFVIDTTAPSAPSSAPDLLPASDSGSSNTDNLTNDNTPAISGGDGAVDGDTVTITGNKAGGGTVSCTYVKSATVTSCDLPAMSDGDWTINATITDPAGNVSPAGPGLNMKVDTTAPSAPSSAPDLLPASDSGSSNTDNVTSDNTPAMTMPGTVDGDTVTMVATSATGSVVICAYVALPTVASCTFGKLADGTWSVVGTITDAAGNTSGVSPALSLTIDTTPPSPVAPDLLPASDNGPSNTDNLTNDSTPAFGMPNANNGDQLTINAKKADGSTVTCTFTKSATVSSCELPAMTDGTWTVDATVTDSAGNKSAASTSMTMVLDTTPPPTPAPPVLPVNPSGQTGDPTPTIAVPEAGPGDTGTATATKGDKSVKCAFVGAPGVRSCDLPMLTPGQWFISTTVTDPAGNVSTPSQSVPIEIVKVGLPAETATLGQVTISGSRTSPTATTALKVSELGKVANVVFVVRNGDGSLARTVRVAASTTSTRVAVTLKSLSKGQRVEAFTENWLGVSRRAPKGSNVVHARTVSAFDKAGRPRLQGTSLGVSRVIFDPTSPLLDANDRAALDRVAVQLIGKGGLVLVSGFARQNLVDSKAFLSQLSIDRAKAVADYLSARGVRAWIRYEGYGAVSRKIGTWEDRKVEIRWVSGASELPGK
ncbi:MAG: hypothetical protein FGM42_06735, partial [Ilumatobacteraceae bacterium]|nr:hypothetical protein [Ilumatobacteraceae bacterium]